MPGLLRMVGRTAVIAGTATAVSNNVSRRQQNRWAAKQQQEQPAEYAQEPPAAYAPPAAAPSDNLTDELQRLADLKTQGILTDEEFSAAKAKLLGD